jgi:N-acetylneuraminic acid mutarotase
VLPLAYFQRNQPMKLCLLRGLFLVLSLLSAALILAAPVGTALSYQGRLNESGQPANGIYDLRFAIYDAAVGGNQMGGLLTNSPVAVSNGFFAVTLDFGEGVFSGEEVWLEIGARSSGTSEDFVTLAPRQQFRPVPYALYAPSAGTAAGLSGSVPASQLSGIIASSNIGAGSISAAMLAASASVSNLYAGGQSGVAVGGIVLSENPTNHNLINAGYVKIGQVDLVPETWSTDVAGPTAASLTYARHTHCAIWTGAEMIIWGGWVSAGGEALTSGARYNPATDSWAPMVRSGAPSARHITPVWTGSKMIIWGGLDEDWIHYINTGAVYDLATDSWKPISTNNAPQAREGHVAVWAGQVMVVWGGLGEETGRPDGCFLGSGGRYNPITDTWSEINTNGAPLGRTGAVGVWTGTEVVVWGGRTITGCVWQQNGFWSYCSDTTLRGGGRYNPVTDTWRGMSGNNSPSGRTGHQAVWTGSQMLVWGGRESANWIEYNDLNTGGCYTPANDTWTAMSTINAPAARDGSRLVWCASRMIIWGGQTHIGSGFFTTNDLVRSGAMYNPALNSWFAMSTAGAPTARWFHSAVSTGQELIVWGGCDVNHDSFDTGGRYKPALNTWVTMPLPTADIEPAHRSQATAVWTGTEMIVWGGKFDLTRLRNGGRYNPAANAWIPLPVAGSPSGRVGHTALWSGSEMLIWGGNDGKLRATGARYNPVLNSWRSITNRGCPVARQGHSAVWTGSEMIVWGGEQAGGEALAPTGGRYNPATDTWTATSTNQAPEGRVYHTAVWTGKDMIVWGGQGATDELTPKVVGLKTGAHYNPVTGRWSATDTNGVPTARWNHTAVWTGSEMIIWGGGTRTANYNTGARYAPSRSDAWIPLPTAGAPPPRSRHTAVWDATQMLVWGGTGSGSICYGDGARYVPLLNQWFTMATNGGPAPRAGHTAVWTGTQMVVANGEDNGTATDTVYSYAPPRTTYLYLKP